MSVVYLGTPNRSSSQSQFLESLFSVHDRVVYFRLQVTIATLMGFLNDNVLGGV